MLSHIILIIAIVIDCAWIEWNKLQLYNGFVRYTLIDICNMQLSIRF
jgi:hypothetical protein